MMKYNNRRSCRRGSQVVTRSIRCTANVTEIRLDLYPEYLINTLHSTRSADNCDVVIKTKEQIPIYAHSAVLRQTNPYFKRALDFKNCKEGRYEVDLGHLSAGTIQDVVDYLYTGQFNIVNKKFLSMVSTLKELDMNDIIQECIEKLKDTLKEANVFKILEESGSEDGVLNNVAMTFIEDNFKTLYKSDRVLGLKWESVKQILSSDRLNVENEDKVYQMALNWVEIDNISRKKFVEDICALIRIPYMTDYGLQNLVCKKNILTNNVKFYNDVETFLGDPSSQPDVYQRINDKMGKIYVFGGCVNRSQMVQTMEIFNRSSGKWEAAEELNTTSTPPSCYSTSTSSLAPDNKIYIVGGQNEEGTRLDSTFVFDGILSIWASAKEMPTVRIRSASSRLGKYLYVTGGQKDRHTMKEVIRYDCMGDQWVERAPMIQSRHSHGMVTAGKKIYVAGGDNGSGPVSSAEIYDVNADQWSEIASMSNLRFGCQLSAIQNQIYATGGWNGRRALHECEKYNSENNSWGYISPMLSRRFGHSTMSFAGKIYALGGMQVQNENAINLVECYTANSNVWERCEEMVHARAWATIGGVL